MDRQINWHRQACNRQCIGSRSQIWLLLGVLLVSLWGCTPGEMTAPGSQATEIAPPTTAPAAAQPITQAKDDLLIVGTAIYSPFEFYDPQTGTLTGFDVAVTQEIADALGMQVQWVEMPFANLLPALEQDKIDMAIAAMYITPERETLVDFSEPYIHTGLVMVANPQVLHTINSTQDLAGLKVGVKIGATGQAFAQELTKNGVPIQIIEYQDTLDSLLDLEVGRLDVVLNDYLNTRVYLKQNPSSLAIVTDPNGNVQYLSNVGLGIAVHENDALLEKINHVLDEMKQNGTLDQLAQDWLNVSTEEK